jgi:mannose-1-phosphate guanylyltransferase
MVITKNRIELTVDELKELSHLESGASVKESEARNTAKAILEAVRNIAERTDKEARQHKTIK